MLFDIDNRGKIFCKNFSLKKFYKTIANYLKNGVKSKSVFGVTWLYATGC